MQHIKLAIERAIEGGWVWKSVEEGGQQFNCNYKTFLDPNFWKSLGKAEGWSTPEKPNEIRDWLGRQHDFIDHLASGGTPDDFFKQILK